MGGCASKPKEFRRSAESPLSSESGAQSNSKGGESLIEKPTVDGSEPEKEAETSSSEAVSAETDVAAENVEDKEAEEAEHRSNDAAIPTKEEVKSDDAPLISL